MKKNVEDTNMSKNPMVLSRASLLYRGVNKEEKTILIECNAEIKLNPKTNTVKPLYTNTAVFG